MKRLLVRRHRVSLAAVLLAWSSLMYVAVPASADGGGAGFWPPDGCWPPGATMPVPGHPDLVFVCTCPDSPAIKANCFWSLRLKIASQGVTASAYVYSSSTYGCLSAWSAIASQAYGASTNIGMGGGLGENYPCDLHSRKSQPAGEYRTQTVFEFWTGSLWDPTTPLGYSYNTSTARGVLDWWDMGAVPDHGIGTYRTSVTIGMYEGGAWRGGTMWAPQIYMN